MVSKTDSEVLAELGERLKQCRLDQNLPLHAVAKMAGLSRTTIVNAENGANPGMETFVRILRVLGRLEALEAFLPGPTPEQLAKRSRKPRQRARTRVSHEPFRGDKPATLDRGRRAD